MQVKVKGYLILALLSALLFTCLADKKVGPLNTQTIGKKVWRNLQQFTYRLKFGHLQTNNTNTQNGMGQAVRIMKYDRAANESNAIGALKILDQALKWHRLDDGVMGGQSETSHSCGGDGGGDGELNFTGMINTNGGGFCSIRSPIPDGLPPNIESIRLRFKGDGKTYKLTLSDGSKSTFGPSIRSPSWQFDIPTTRSSDKEEEITIPLASLKPSWGGGPLSQPSDDDRKAVQFNPSSVREIGFMLSLKLSDGRSNPVETFGTGIFPFSLKISSIEPILKDEKAG